MTGAIGLLWIGEAPPRWDAGPVAVATPDPCGIARAGESFGGDVELLLSWHPRWGAPDEALLRELASDETVDVWHAGLLLGQRGHPRLLDHVDPVWMLNSDANPTIESSSWRLALAACLVRTRVLQDAGWVDPTFRTVSGSALELGLRYLRRGHVIRHTPRLLPVSHGATVWERPQLEDQLRIVRRHYGSTWTWWAAMRGYLSGALPAVRTAKALAAVLRDTSDALPAQTPAPLGEAIASGTVGVLIPTLDRYDYLARALEQLGRQTVAPHRVVVVDQSRTAKDHDLVRDFPDLPLEVIILEQPGQCSARNAGLERLDTDFVLFIDDDDDVPEDLLETHLRFFAGHPAADASCGSVTEADSGVGSETGWRAGIAPVFPTNNTLLRRRALASSGGFDLAYDRGSRADHDVGTRLYLAGRLLLSNPAAHVVHHRAGAGGLRHHGARVFTRAMSRSTPAVRNIVSFTEVYLWHRYFSPRQVREAYLIRLVSVFRRVGTKRQRGGRLLTQLALFPQTSARSRRAVRRGLELFDEHPTVPDVTR